MLTPSCPVSLVQCQLLFVSTDHCISVIWMSGTHNLFFPPPCQNACRSPTISH
ncbi:unnamed protein product [Staurois parvus]|uniref:Uncharacterized protein n=1 Tax=Staurois parvus TaxID=386267 RepID=A0ABN9EM74_9NEOB|nr:unnamed protein product [Staurois parvus]